MTDTFTGRPVNTPTGTSSFSVLTAQFGDGYSQEAANGINNESQSWPLTFTGSKAEMKTIVDFFRDHAGATGFYWTPPLGTQGIYKVASFTMQPNGRDVFTVAATFVQRFAP